MVCKCRSLDDGWWRHTFRGLDSTDADHGPGCPEDYREEVLGQNRLKLVMAETREEVQWQTFTDNRIIGDSLELAFVDRVMRQSRARRAEHVHARCWMVEPDQHV